MPLNTPRPSPMYLLALPLLSHVLLAQSGTGTIQGTVTDAKSQKPIAGAFVTAIRDGLPPFSQNVKAGAGGGFQLENLPAGKFSLCVQAPGDAYLDPCQWINGGVTVSLAAGQKSAGNTVRLQTGSVVRVRIQDPGQLLAQKTKDGHDHHLGAGVWGPGGMCAVQGGFTKSREHLLFLLPGDLC